MFQGVSTRVILIATGCALLWARPYAGQVTPGRLEERVPSATDTSQAFALYLPPGTPPSAGGPCCSYSNRGGGPYSGSNCFKQPLRASAGSCLAPTTRLATAH